MSVENPSFSAKSVSSAFLADVMSHFSKSVNDRNAITSDKNQHCAFHYRYTSNAEYVWFVCKQLAKIFTATKHNGIWCTLCTCLNARIGVTLMGFNSKQKKHLFFCCWCISLCITFGLSKLLVCLIWIGEEDVSVDNEISGFPKIENFLFLLVMHLVFFLVNSDNKMLHSLMVFSSMRKVFDFTQWYFVSPFHFTKCQSELVFHFNDDWRVKIWILFFHLQNKN